LARKPFRTLIGHDRFLLARHVPADCDVVWHPCNGTFFEGRVPSVVTIHDVVPFAYPDANPKKRASQQEPFLRSAAQAAAIVTDSAFSASEIERHLGVDPQKIHRIALGVGSPFAPSETAAQQSGEPYILAVSSGEPHKNLAPLIEGARDALAGRLAQLTIVGTTLPAAQACKSLGSVSEASLLELYRGALFLAAPGTYEGFGLPLLEAMACGTPVLAARAGPYPEVCGEAAAYVDAPSDAHAWAAAISALFDDEPKRAALRDFGLRRVADFTWERTAAATLEVLRRCASA
jgi:alpha-1,3-rhamnosyl/mannosyltransferase